MPVDLSLLIWGIVGFGVLIAAAIAAGSLAAHLFLDASRTQSNRPAIGRKTERPEPPPG